MPQSPVPSSGGSKAAVASSERCASNSEPRVVPNPRCSSSKTCSKVYLTPNVQGSDGRVAGRGSGSGGVTRDCTGKEAQEFRKETEAQREVGGESLPRVCGASLPSCDSGPGLPTSLNSHPNPKPALLLARVRGWNLEGTPRAPRPRGQEAPGAALPW